MSLSESLTQQRLQEILMDIYRKANENSNLSLNDLIEELKSQILKKEVG